MSELEYYESNTYREFLLSSRRKEICNPEMIFQEFPVKNCQNILDFGFGNGFFLPDILRQIGTDAWCWGAECQQDLIDELLQKKLKEQIPNFTPFYIEKSDHPLLPEWIPKPEIIFTSLCLSTFPNPGLAMDGLIQSMVPEGRLIIIDWAKVDYPEGPRVKDKVSLDKMKFLAEDFNLEIIKAMRISEYIYGMEVRAGKEFEYGYYDLKEEESETPYTF